jgi:putative membrane protein
MSSTPAAALLLLTLSLATPALPGAGLQAQSQTLDDPTIVAIFDAANSADMETGALAEQHAASKEVRDFGAMLVRDHRMVRQQGRDLAAKLGVTPTPPNDDQSAKDHAAAMARLRSLQGADFDRAFLQQEAAFHQAVIDAVTTTLLPSIRNSELKALVEKVAPAFQAHLKMAQELEKKIAGGNTGDRASSR